MPSTVIEQALLLYFLDALPATRFCHLLRSIGSAEHIMQADRGALRGAGLNEAQVQAIAQCESNAEIRQQVDSALAWHDPQRGRHIVLYSDPHYPALLREIHDPPPLLFVLGQLQALLCPQIAMIGSRRCSVDGMGNASRFAQFLASQHFSVCSGMARGIDTCAHEGALRADGVTVAVLGTGVDVVYPKSNRALSEKIQQRGALVSELPLGSKAIASHFPKRNRIISGMSAGVIVVEAAIKSGSLITARLAIEQNRELFAIPGSIRNPLCLGPHRLIQQGAALIDSPEQVLEQLDSLLGSQISLLRQTTLGAGATKVSLGLTEQLNKEARCVIQAMGYDPVPLEIIVERSALPLIKVQTQLLQLELDGHIRHHLGQYVLC